MRLDRRTLLPALLAERRSVPFAALATLSLRSRHRADVTSASKGQDDGASPPATDAVVLLARQPLATRHPPRNPITRQRRRYRPISFSIVTIAIRRLANQ
jgi:hypothetical protein